MGGGFGGPPGGFGGPPPMEGGFRGDFRGRDPRGSGSSPEERAERYVGFMSRLDENQDGFVSQEEIQNSRFAQFIIPRLSERAGRDVSGGFRISEIRDGLVKYYRDQEQGGSGQPSPSQQPTSGSSTANGPSPQIKILKLGPPGTVPGFGVPSASTGLRPQGFGTPTTAADPQASPGSSSSPSSTESRDEGGEEPSPPPPPIDERIARFTDGLMQRYDENKNGVLEKEEWSKMRGDWAPADADGDSNISREELSRRLTELNGGSRRPEGGDGRSDSPPAPSASPVSVKRYRFSSPYDRLPEGLPSWFRERDKDRDGQVLMAEYADRWTEDTYREFSKYDRNGDGIIEPAECLKAE
ncbi:MAG: hypothetical protein GYA33_03750 [Thermogutta sp.]|nr:hypothetical protein [Thermogutta sp.]